MPRISIDLDDELFDDLKKRAQDNFLSIREMVEDIIRRSMITYKKNSRKTIIDIEDRLISIFSRERRGRYKKKR